MKPFFFHVWLVIAGTLVALTVALYLIEAAPSFAGCSKLMFRLTLVDSFMTVFSSLLSQRKILRMLAFASGTK